MDFVYRHCAPNTGPGHARGGSTVDKPFPVLAVCLGNICRSPLVERLLTVRLEEAGVGAAYVVGSAGLVAREGIEMQWDAAGHLAALGGDPTSFRSRALADPMAQEAGLVLTATTDVRRRLLQKAPSALRRTFTVREFAHLASSADLGAVRSPTELVADAVRRRGTTAWQELDLPDPMGQTAEVHAASARLAAEAVEEMVPALVAAAAAPATR